VSFFSKGQISSTFRNGPNAELSTLESHFVERIHVRVPREEDEAPAEPHVLALVSPDGTMGPRAATIPDVLLDISRHISGNSSGKVLNDLPSVPENLFGLENTKLIRASVICLDMSSMEHRLRQFPNRFFF
jgi:hypothetical protein